MNTIANTSVMLGGSPLKRFLILERKLWHNLIKQRSDTFYSGQERMRCQAVFMECFCSTLVSRAVTLLSSILFTISKFPLVFLHAL